MKKIMLVLSGLIGIIFSVIGFYVLFPVLLGAGGAIAPELTISQEKRFDEQFNQSLLWLIFFLVIFIVSLILFVWGIKQKRNSGERKK